MALITVLTSLDKPQVKMFREGVQQKHGNAFKFDTSFAEVNDLAGLGSLLQALEVDIQSSIIRGAPVDTDKTKNVHRRSSGYPITFKPQDCQWLCIDIDTLELPTELIPINEHQEEIARFTASHLPGEFDGIDFYFQFSANMGMKAGIKIHLWYWLERSISDEEAKGWLSQATTDIDLALYRPIQVHYTAAPIFDPPEQNPLTIRSGVIVHGDNRNQVRVPDDLKKFWQLKSKNQRTITKPVNKNGIIDHERIARDENGKVIDGREYLIFSKSVDAIKELTKGSAKPDKFDDLDALTNMIWGMFSEEADISDEKWTIEDSKEKALARIDDLRNGWLPNGRSDTTSLVPEVEPYFYFEAINQVAGSAKLTETIHRFFNDVFEFPEEIQKRALKITMGSGKTTVTLEKLKDAFRYNPNLNAEIYVPRHDLAVEIFELLENELDGVEVVVVRGRGQDHENGNAPCRRYDYVRSLEKSGLAVRTNACRRNDEERCEFLDDCAYWRQFSKSTKSSGSIRIFPHAYLGLERDEHLPHPDITIIDESFLSAVHSAKTISEPRLRGLLNDHLQGKMGDLIAETLRDGFPFLAVMREMGITPEALAPSNLDDAEQQIQFSGTKNNSPRKQLANNADVRNAKQILRVICEEFELRDRQNISRLRYNSKTAEIHVDIFDIKHIAENTHLLILDATADEIILEKLFGNINFERIDIEQKAYVTQVYDRTGSNLTWERDDNVDDLVLMLNEHSVIGENVLCICHKSLADHLRSQSFPDNLKFEHFGNLRGIDAYKDFDTIFITGRNQPPQAGIDGIARALYWNDEKALDHDEAASLNAAPETDLPTEVRGYFLTNPDIQFGVNVRTFKDGRIEAIHQQIREAETIQAIARLRLVHSKKIKSVYLLGNLPLTPRGWMKMRPDMVNNINKAQNINKRYGLKTPQNLLNVSPMFARLGCWIMTFRPEGEKPQKHLFRAPMTTTRTEVGEVAGGSVPFKEWEKFIIEGDPGIDKSGWGKITKTDFEWLTPDALILDDIDLEDDLEKSDPSTHGGQEAI